MKVFDRIAILKHQTQIITQDEQRIADQQMADTVKYCDPLADQIWPALKELAGVRVQSERCRAVSQLLIRAKKFTFPGIIYITIEVAYPGESAPPVSTVARISIRCDNDRGRVFLVSSQDIPESATRTGATQTDREFTDEISSLVNLVVGRVERIAMKPTQLVDSSK